MPAILSHHLFGRALLARQDNRAFLTRDVRDAFLLGNQGPDPLFYASRTVYLMNSKKLGVYMHNEKIEDYFESWRSILDRLHSKDNTHEIVRAYIHGVFCHYFLDRAVHPLVFLHVNALCRVGIKGLEPRDERYVHGQLEADLDVYMLHKLTGRTLEEYSIPKQLLYASDTALSTIDTLYTTAADLYSIKVPCNVFSRSVKDMRVAEKLLYSPGGTKRTILGRLERLLKRHSYLQSMSHSVDGQHTAWFANEDKAYWQNPFTHTKNNKSFIELFEDALDTAQVYQTLFDAGVPLSVITKGLDYFGNAKPWDRKP